MQTGKILLADDHSISRGRVAEYLRKQQDVEAVAEAANGAEALKRLTTERFDVVVTEIIMPVMDGFLLMDNLHRLERAPKVIVASALGRDDFVTRAMGAGAAYYILKPFEPEHLLRHIRELLSTEVRSGAAAAALAPSSAPSADERLGNLFLTLGIPAHIKGFHFLRDGIKMVIEQPDMINRITKELYPGIAKHFSTSASKVERAIRHAIEVAWNRGRVDTLNKAFGCRVCTPEDKPTNGEFIAMLADKLRLEKSL